MKLEGRTILITGASQGIGAAAARAFAAYPVNLVLLARSQSLLESLAGELNAREGVQALPIVADIARPEEIEAAVARALDAFGRIDILVNNAGVGMSSPVGAIDYDKARTLFDINFWGALRMTEAVLPAMRERKEGLIINISSIVGRRAMPGISVYCASKFALNAFSESIRVELKQDNVRVVSFYPGVTATNFGDNLLTGPASTQGKGRAKVTSAEDVGKAIVKAAIKEPRDAYPTWFDHLFVWVSLQFPWLMDRLLTRFQQD
jgi:short-subunit dehydrogenase